MVQPRNKKPYAGLDACKAPFPWFGGKRQAAPVVWLLLGDPCHYVEPFAGTLAVLLERPHLCNQTYYSETINDADGLLVNAWRAIQWHPVETARAASWPVTEADKMARQIACLKWRTDRNIELLRGSPEWCDPRVAGYWLYGVCCQIGAFVYDGPWTADPETGRAYCQARGNSREPGVFGDRPHLADNGLGVNRPQLREPGVFGDLPHLAGDGQGVNRPQLREPGVAGNRPDLADNGLGVNHASTREPGVLSDTPGNEFHPLTMPKLVRWFQLLSARLRHVRIVNGDWKRVCTAGAMFTLSVRQNDGVCGVFIDPPYSLNERAELYEADRNGRDLAAEARDWCLKWGQDKRLRIVLAGFDTEHTQLEQHGWTVHEWFKKGHLRGGMGSQKADGHQQHRERLWASPRCINPENIAWPLPPAPQALEW